MVEVEQWIDMEAASIGLGNGRWQLREGGLVG
jgi:hypothetical protein